MDQSVTSKVLLGDSSVDAMLDEMNRKVNSQSAEIENLKKEIDFLKEETTQAMHMVRMVNTKLLELNSKEESNLDSLFNTNKIQMDHLKEETVLTNRSLKSEIVKMQSTNNELNLLRLEVNYLKEKFAQNQVHGDIFIHTFSKLKY